MQVLWIIDDNLALLHGLNLALESDYHLTLFKDPASCLQALREGNQPSPDLLLTDLEMPGMTGLQLLAQILPAHPSIRAYLMTSALTQDLITQAQHQGLQGWIRKPFELEQLKGMLKGG